MEINKIEMKHLLLLIFFANRKKSGLQSDR